MNKWEEYQRKRSIKNRKARTKRLIEARKKGTHTKEEWEEMQIFFDNYCVRCHTPMEQTIKDHIIPLYLGGSDSIKNIQPVCKPCNSSKTGETADCRPTFCVCFGLLMPRKWEQIENEILAK